MVCERYKTQKMLDDFSKTLLKIRNGDLRWEKVYHREGDHWWIENIAYERDADGNFKKIS